MSTRRQRELLKQNRLLVRQEALAEREIKAHLLSCYLEVAERYTLADPDGALDVFRARSGELEEILKKRLHQTALIFGGRTLDRITANLPKSYYAGLAPGTGPVRGRDEVGMERKLEGDRFYQEIGRWIAYWGVEKAVTISAGQILQVRHLILDTLPAGLSEAMLRDMIKAKANHLAPWQAARIARTEVHTASTIGADTAARSTGLDMVKEWLAAEDHRTRESHAEADGQEVGLNESFEVGGVLLEFPGDPKGPAREIINCRCAILHHPVIGGEVIK